MLENDFTTENEEDSPQRAQRRRRGRGVKYREKMRYETEGKGEK